MKGGFIRIILINLIVLSLNSMIAAQDLSNRVGIGFLGSFVKMVGGDVDRSTIEQWGGIQFNYGLSPTLGLNAVMALGWVYPKEPGGSHFKAIGGYKTFLAPIDLNFTYNLLPDSKFRPYVAIGTGVTFWDIRKLNGDGGTFATGTSVDGRKVHLSLIGGFGFEYLVSDKVALNTIFNYHRLLKGEDDTIGFGDDGNNAVAELRFGLSYYFGGLKDTDKDGIKDKFDLDPQHAEDFDGFMDDDGAPDLDNDNDGVPDVKDKAPNTPEDIDGFEDEDGVPDLDNDKDGIPDEIDKCPNIPEDFDGFEDSDGCPELDNDNDGIVDSLDQCPNEPENINGYLDKDGCPDEKPMPPPIEKGKKVVLKGVNFASGSAELTADSYSVLNNVYQTLKDFPNIEIEIRGYTDSIGDFNENQRLSERRANAVKFYLVERGIDYYRIRVVGYGELDPIADNVTREGRALNRRIEFVRTK